MAWVKTGTVPMSGGGGAATEVGPDQPTDTTDGKLWYDTDEPDPVEYGVVPIVITDTPPTPPFGQKYLFVKSDGTYWTKDSDGVVLPFSPLGGSVGRAVTVEYRTPGTNLPYSIPNGAKRLAVILRAGGEGGNGGHRFNAAPATSGYMGNFAYGGVAGVMQYASLDVATLSTNTLLVTVGAGGLGGDPNLAIYNDGISTPKNLGSPSRLYNGATLLYEAAGGTSSGGYRASGGTSGQWTNSGTFTNPSPGQTIGVDNTLDPGGAAGTAASPHGQAPVEPKHLIHGAGGGGAWCYFDSADKRNGGNGGNGVAGGGGGGGGLAWDGYTPGRGGNGGDGFVRITAYFD